MNPVRIFLFCLLLISWSNRQLFAQDINQLSYEDLDSISEIYIDEANFEAALPYALKCVEKAKEIALDSNYAYSLNNLGFVYQELGNYEQAASFLKEALALDRTIYGEQSALQTSSLMDLAFLYLDLGEYENAEKLFKEAIVVAKKYKGEKSEKHSEAMNSLAILYSETGEYEAAEKLLLKSLAIIKTIYGKVSEEYAFRLNNLALIYSDKAEYKAAENQYLKAAEIERELNGDGTLFYATNRNNLASLYESMGEYKKAETTFLEGIKIDAQIYGKEHRDYAISISNLAKLYEKMGRFDEAMALSLEALQIREKIFGKMHHHVAISLNNIAVLHTSMGNFEAAEPLYTRTIEIRKKMLGVEHPDYGLALNDLAKLYIELNHFEAAEHLFTEAIAIRKKVLGEHHPDYGESLNDLAKLFLILGDYEEAEPLFQQALAIRRKSLGVDHPEYASSLNDLAGLYMNLGINDAAEPLFVEALAIRKKVLGPLHAGYAETMNDLANLYAEWGEYEKAEKMYLQTLAIDEQSYGKNHPNYAISLNNLANLYCEMEEDEKAMIYYKKCLEIFRTAYGNKHPDYASVFNDMGTMYIIKDELDVATEYFHKAILANCKTEKLVLDNNWAALTKNSFYSLDVILASLSELHYIYQVAYEDTGEESELNQAYALSKLCMHFTTLQREELRSAEDKLRALSAMSELVDQSITEALVLSNEKNKKQYAIEAFSFAEENKSILLADAIKGNKARGLGDLPPSLAKKERALQTELDVLKKAEIEAESSNRQTEIIAKLNALNLEMERFKLSLKDKYPKYHALKYEKIRASVADLQKEMDEETALLEYFAADSVTYLFYVDKHHVEAFEIPISKEKMHREVKVLRGVLSNYKYLVEHKKKAFNQFMESSYWFYNKLVAPALAKKRNIKNLVIVPDYELGHLPFEVFLVEGGDQKGDYHNLHYLVRDYNISYNYSATLWHENMISNQAQKTQNSAKILAMAGDYKGVDSSLASIRSPYAMSLRKILTSLPAAQKEVSSLEKLYAGDFRYGTNANEAFFKENAADYAVIHLAMHGILDRRTPILSSLAFSENRDSLQDNFLQAYEISHQKLNADLVVLSACETGYGKFEQGEGVLSLARSFMYAGVPSLVVSLWQVSDESTALIMKNFYRELATGKPKDEALRLAKINYLDQMEGINAHPAFWSAFIQIGDNSAIQISKIGVANWTKYGLIMLALIVISILLFVRYRKYQTTE